MRPLSVALLSWEYPPVVVGGLSRHVYELSRHLAQAGHEVTVYTRGHPDAPSEEVREGVRLVRVQGYPPPLDDLIPWTLTFNIALIHRAMDELAEGRADVLHAHDWLVAYASTVLADLCSLPLVATIHATELGRHRGRLPGPRQTFVHEVERWLVSEAERVITCSAFMREQVSDSLGADRGRLDLIPNEVDLTPFADPPGAPGTGSPTVLFAGRLEYEKGVQTLLEALPRIAREVPGVRLLIAGNGTYRPELERLAAELELDGLVSFEGFVDESRLRSLYRSADIAIVPSLYEPFGLVVLEAMASGTPVVASDTGGLCEILTHDVTGLLFSSGDAAELASTAVRVLKDQTLGARLALEARSSLSARGSWTTAATRTAETYRRAVESFRSGTPRLREVSERRA
ncbi:MAG: glycosyltransferase family 4 protein [Actinomycetota bacterium]